MQESVLRLRELGVPPKGFESNEPQTDEVAQIWDDWIDAVDSIERPITWEEAEILIKCCPTEPMAEVEWALLHCIESVFNSENIESFRKLIEQCNSDMMRDLLTRRLNNYVNKRK